MLIVAQIYPFLPGTGSLTRCFYGILTLIASGLVTYELFSESERLAQFRIACSWCWLRLRIPPRVLVPLRDIMSPESVKRWWTTPEALLRGISPKKGWESGLCEMVLTGVDRLREENDFFYLSRFSDYSADSAPRPYAFAIIEELRRISDIPD